MFFKFPERHPQRTFLVEFNPYQILAAEITQARRGSVVLESAAEFNRDDADGLRRWIESKDNGRKARITVLCGLAPVRSIMQRESVQPARLAEPGYLEEVAEEQQKGRFLSATPFRIFKASTWTLRAVSALDGAPLPPTGPSRPALICAIANKEIVEVQQRLLGARTNRYRVEPGLLSLFGAVYDSIERRGGTHAVAIVVVHQSVTAIYILGKEGVHTPNPVLHGLLSIIEMGRKELGVIDEAEVLTELQIGNPDLVHQAPKLVRRIARDLKPVIDSYEMTTGQPVDEIHCAYLPPVLNWLAVPLADAIGRVPLVIDYEQWFPTAGLQVSENGPRFGPHWLGALNLVAKLPETSGLKSKRNAGEDSSYQRPWHVDCSVPIESEERKLAGRRFVTAAVVLTLTGFALIFTAWQLYATQSFQADRIYWEKQMAGSRRLFENLKSANAAVKAKSTKLEHADALMGQPYQLSNLLLDLGRTIPPRMRVDRIDTNDLRVTISGSLLEPAEEASGTLGRHMEDIRQDPALGPLFSQIAITSLQRNADTDVIMFELTLRLKPLPM